MSYGKRMSLMLLCCALAGALWGTAATASGESTFYTFDRNVDPTWWPDSPPGVLPDDGGWWTDDLDIFIANYTNNNLFFDASYQAAGNSGVMQGPAMWGNPKTDPWWSVLEFEFYNTPNGYAESISFDFSWAVAGKHADTYLWMEFNDGVGNYEDIYYPLDISFNAGAAFGGFQGAAGHVHIEPFGSLEDIAWMAIGLQPIATGGGTGEFAIDNFNFNGHGGGGDTGDPLDSSIYVATDIGELEGLIGVSTNRLRGSFGGSYELFVYNEGDGSTTFSVQVEPGGMQLGSPAVNEPIHPGQWVSTGTLVTYDANLPSGKYEAEATISNDLNPGDGQETIFMHVSIYDPPQLSDNAGSTIDPGVDGAVWLANAAAGPHAGALRAGVEITDVNLSGHGFGFSGIDVDDFAGAGEQLAGQVSFNAAGKLAGVYNGVLTLGMQMNSAAGSYLNGRTPMDDLVWSLQYTVPTVTENVTALGAGQDFAEAALGIHSPTTAAALIGGSASADQEVSLSFTDNPEAGGFGTAAILGSAIELTFAQGGDVYVLQLTYDPANLPAGLAEIDLRLLFYDPAAMAWIDAIDANSDGGEGEQFYLGSFSDFVATLGGGPLPLSAHGLDIEENTVWAVLNHASVFATGVVPEPRTATLLLLALLSIFRRQRWCR
jgi:hypothetical protein